MTSGHNSIAADKLRSMVERIERLEEEKRHLSEDIRDIYKEAASAGYDKKALRALIAERAKDAAAVAEHQALVETYRAALAGLADTPLGAAALERVG